MASEAAPEAVGGDGRPRGRGRAEGAEEGGGGDFEQSFSGCNLVISAKKISV